MRSFPLYSAATVLVLVSLLLTPGMARAGLDKPLGVPVGLSAEATVRLTRIHQQLMIQFNALTTAMANNKSACSQVADDDTDKINGCRRDGAELKREIDAYEKAESDYERALGAAAVMPLTEREWPPLKSFVLPGVRVTGGEAFFVLRSGQRVNARHANGLPIDNGAALMVGPDTRVEVLLPDETIVTFQGVGDGGGIIFESFIYDPATANTAFTARLAKGIFRWVTGHTTGPRPEPKIIIPVGSLGFRGTDGEVQVQSDHSGWIKMRSGSAVLTPRDGGPPITLGPGQMVVFTAAGAIGTPEPIR